MTFSFRDKCVFLISPVKWGNMKVSKHHYAVELAKAGASVYFIEPPCLQQKEKVKIEPIPDASGLWKLTYKPMARGRRFLPLPVYKLLLKMQASVLTAFVKRKPDVVLSFDPGRFEDLHFFKARHRIFFAGDLFHTNPMPGEVTTANFCLGVSSSILQQLLPGNSKSFFIHHGLNASFASLAQQRLQNLSAKQPLQKQLVAGFIGNLFIEAMDRVTMKKVVLENPEVQFVFWGMYERNQDTIVPFETPEVHAFIDFLKSSKNVKLMGVKNHHELMDEVKMVDVFWYCYNGANNHLWDGSNSHKILEYLATGRPVISHHVSTYADTELLYMMPTQDNTSFPALFNEVKELVKNGEPVEREQKRLQFALQNTYSNKVTELENLIDQNTKD